MVDYSKWSQIEISDDEDDTHPHIHTPSLFQLRHKARVDRVGRDEKAIEKIYDMQKTNNWLLKKFKKFLTVVQKYAPENMEEVKTTISIHEVQKLQLEDSVNEWKEKQKKVPWNVDSISHDGFDTTAVNKLPATSQRRSFKEIMHAININWFTDKYENEIETFSLLECTEDSLKFLTKHEHLVCEGTVHYLTIKCLNFQLEEAKDSLACCAYQTVCMQYILVMATQLKCKPRMCLNTFYSNLQDKKFKEAFHDELSIFKLRMEERAKERIEYAMQEADEDFKSLRTGPGGLDPVEVLKSLPKEMKTAFESQNILMLQTVIKNMDSRDMLYQVQRCIDAGLWISNNEDISNLQLY